MMIKLMIYNRPQKLQMMNSFFFGSHTLLLLLLLLMVFSVMISKSHGWIFLPTTTTTTTSSSSFSHNYSYDNDKKKKFSSSSLFASYSSNTGSNDDDDEEPDLFDYFDPLKSPHEYPNGIDDSAKSDNKKETSNNDNDNDNNNNNDEKMYSINVFGMDKLQKRQQQQQQQQQQQGEDAASTAASSSSTQTSAAEVSSSTEQDLFDYFDPLKSPHEYPNGIDNSNTAMKKDGEEEEDSSDDNNNYTNVSTSSDNNNKPYSMNVFGMDYGLPVKPLEVVSDDESTTSTSTPTPASASASPKSAGEDKKENQDLFDYFDPLKSPHEYPNGIGKNTANNTNDKDDDEEDRYDPLDLRKKRNAIMEKEDGNNSNSSSSSSSTSNDNTQTTKVGILLMDHGSRNQDSNKRLQYIAELYQQMTIMESEQEGNNNSAGTSTSTSATTVVVRAAHMEIATPSIPDGLQSLLDENVDEIICHPFFLSPAGRHVREDIPAIINQAIETLDIDIPIITTEPIGSNIQLMIGAIHASVRENSNLLIKQQKSTKS